LFIRRELLELERYRSVHASDGFYEGCGYLAVIEAVIEFSHVAVKVFYAHLMKAPYQTQLEQRPVILESVLCACSREPILLFMWFTESCLRILPTIL